MYQRKRLEDEYEFINRSFQRIWGALPPSDERNDVMRYLHLAKASITKMLKETGQMNMDDFLNELEEEDEFDHS